MTHIEMLVTEFDRETAVTRQLLERVPEDRTSWRPHARSWTLGELSLHLATLPTWMPATLRATELDLNPPGGPLYPRPVFESARATVRAFDSHVSDARAALTGALDAELDVSWTLKNACEVIFTMPRAAVLRTFVFNHSIHHRGQLSVYLRLCDVPVPPIYGPTADSDPS
jgi:uncharacterized damage-inducible protein DinB